MPLSHVLVLTAAPGSGAITEQHVREISARAPRAGDGAARWLARGNAWELAFTAADDAETRRAADDARAALTDAPVDVNVVRTANRRKWLLTADMESTIIEQELIDEIATLVGCHAEISAITAAAMRGEINFEASLAQRVALFAGLDVDRLRALLDRVTLMPGAETLVATMRAHSATCALVSGGFTLFAETIGARLGFDAVVANVLDVSNGRLTGRVQEPILGPEGKASALARLAAAHSVPRTDTIAVGDGANDVAMLTAAGLGVAFRAKPVLAAHARSLPSGAVIKHGDLSALLFLQGYTQDAFALR
jgi:phosphoserine phosphatase